MPSASGNAHHKLCLAARYMFGIERTPDSARGIIVPHTTPAWCAMRQHPAHAAGPAATVGLPFYGSGTTNCADRIRSLASCRDASSLKSAVQELCTEFGKVTHIDVLTMAEAERRRALCFLRMESTAQEQQLMRTLGAPRFGDDVLIVVDLSRGSPRSAP